MWFIFFNRVLSQSINDAGNNVVYPARSSLLISSSANKLVLISKEFNLLVNKSEEYHIVFSESKKKLLLC